MKLPRHADLARVLALVACVACLAGLGLPPSAWADPLPEASTEPELPSRLPLWELGFGAAFVQLPHYRGSDQSHDWLLPVPYAVYRGPILRADRDGARAVLLDTRALDVDLSLSATAPTRSRDDRARSGMPDLAPTVEIGPSMNLTLGRGPQWKLSLRVPVRAVFTVQSSPQAIGVTVAPVLNLDWRLSGWNLGLQGGPLAATRRYDAYFYSVAPAYATAGRPSYDAPGGAAGWQAGLSSSRRFAQWWLGAYARVDSVANAAFELSPLVRQRQTYSFGFAASWVFKTSEADGATSR